MSFLMISWSNSSGLRHLDISPRMLPLLRNICAILAIVVAFLLEPANCHRIKHNGIVLAPVVVHPEHDPDTAADAEPDAYTFANSACGSADTARRERSAFFPRVFVVPPAAILAVPKSQTRGYGLASKKPRFAAKSKPKPRRANLPATDQKTCRSVAYYLSPGADEDMADAIPSWTQPVGGAWIIVVLPRRQRQLAWMAYEACAHALPETWVDEVQGERLVFGVDGIVRGRWNLKYNACTRARAKRGGERAQSIAYTILHGLEKEVVLSSARPRSSTVRLAGRRRCAAGTSHAGGLRTTVRSGSGSKIQASSTWDVPKILHPSGPSTIPIKQTIQTPPDLISQINTPLPYQITLHKNLNAFHRMLGAADHAGINVKLTKEPDMRRAEGSAVVAHVQRVSPRLRAFIVNPTFVLRTSFLSDSPMRYPACRLRFAAARAEGRVRSIAHGTSAPRPHAFRCEFDA
ncbi:hypothetical protein B0H11DRAFT_2251060 [Mycena galericulata]|nr:hypothetical protein B0H11DRAFT_2251060 [Mycena galericulata]